MSSLEKIEIRGFKSIREEPGLQLNQLNILIGANGVGKTNFVGLFSLLNAMIEGELELYVGKKGGADSFLHFGRKTTPKLSVKLFFGRNGYFFDLEPTADNAFIFSKEDAFFDGPIYGQTTRTLGVGHKEAKIDKAKGTYGHTTRKIAEFVIAAIKSWKVYHFHDTSDSAPVKQVGSLNDNLVLHPNGSNLAAFLFFLQEAHKKHYEDIRTAVQQVAPFFDDFVLRPNPLNKTTIQLEWKEKGSDIPFLAHHLSDGTLRFILLATLLLQPQPPDTIIIDEPELGLHPFAINFLASLIKSVSKEKQIIISTQSVTFVNQFDPENLIVVDRKDGQTVFKRLDSEQVEAWLTDYSLGDLWEKNWIGGRP